MSVVELNEMTSESVDFVYECLKELRGDLQYSAERFRAFVSQCGLLNHPDFVVYVGSSEGRPVGILTCNRFVIPRYLGYGIELEEVVVHPDCQRRGYGKALIKGFLERVREDLDVRKVIVKTDDGAKAGKLYSQFFDTMKTTVYVKPINYL